MVSISLCMIVKNEEKVISRCLDCVKDIVDEIIIVDTGSTDKTKEIVSNYTNKIYDFNWQDDFSSARNYSFSKATKDFIFWLDADDILLKEDKEKFLKLKEFMDTSIDIVTMIYNLRFDEFNNVVLRNRRIRLVKKENSFGWIGAVHEYINAKTKTNNKVINSDVCVSHKKLSSAGDRNIKIYERRLEKGYEFSARDFYCYGNELFNRKLYEKAIECYKRFFKKDYENEDAIDVCNKLSDYYKNINDIKCAKKYCLKSLEYDIPGAEQCCRLGFYFFIEDKIKAAIFWYKLATTLDKPKNSVRFITESYWTWLPHIQLGICYTLIGSYEDAYEHIQIAKQYRPEDEAILYNEQLVKKLLNKKNIT